MRSCPLPAIVLCARLKAEAGREAYNSRIPVGDGQLAMAVGPFTDSMARHGRMCCGGAAADGSRWGLDGWMDGWMDGWFVICCLFVYWGFRARRLLGSLCADGWMDG